MLPPSPLVKKCMPRSRSSPRSAHTTVSAGKAKVIRMLAQRAVQVNSGIRIKVIPGARRLRIVTTKLMPVIVVPMPLIKMAQIQ